jgi:hypothetical protein
MSVSAPRRGRGKAQASLDQVERDSLLEMVAAWKGARV